MKKIYFAFMLISSFLVKAQTDQEGIETILFATEDASKLTGAYIKPAMKGLVYGMNNGWYHTAKAHQKFGFDISIGMNLSFITEKDETFNFSDLGLTKTTSAFTSAPTIAGSNKTETPMTVKTTIDGKSVSANFNMPAGIKEDLPISAVPAPAIQVGLGLPYDFEIMARFVPKVGSEEITGQLFGLGVKKELTKLFFTTDKLPLHVSLLAAYTTMNVDFTIVDDSVVDNISIRNGNAAIKLNSYTVQAIASLNFPIFNLYGGIGYGGGNSTVSLNGDYILTYNIDGGGTLNQTLTKPINEKFNVGSLRGTLGTRISLGFFKIFADYTIQEYHTANGGISFSFN